MEKSTFGDSNKVLQKIMKDIVYTKTLDWEYEKEHRLAIPTLDNEENWNTLTYHPTEITRLYLGAKISKAVKNEIINLARAINPKIEILNATIVNEKLLFETNPNNQFIF